MMMGALAQTALNAEHVCDDHEVPIVGPTVILRAISIRIDSPGCRGADAEEGAG